MAEASEPAEVYDSSECTLVPSSGETFEEARITSSTVFVTEDSGSRLIASQRKISYQTDTLFYQQTSEFFLSYPPAERMGGLVGRFARMLGGNFREEPQDMLQMESIDAAAGDTPSRSNSCSCRLSLETQRVSAHRLTYTYACILQCCVNACVVSLKFLQMLREEVFSDGLSAGDVVDYHAHLVGHSDSGSFLHPSTKTWWSPLQRLKGAILMSAAQVCLDLCFVCVLQVHVESLELAW